MSAAALLFSLMATALPASHPFDGDLADAFATVEARCFECHAGSNIKGGLRLDEMSGWLKSIDRESPVDSELLYRMRLPAGDVDAMPPKGDRIGESAITTLQGWIEAGADGQAMQALLDASAARTVKRTEWISTLATRLGAVIERVRPKGGQAESAAALPLFRVSWSHSPVVPTGEQLAGLLEMAEQTVEISFAGTGVTDELLAALPKLPALKRAHLERTELTDAGVGALVERAPGLEYLNVHSTGVSANLANVVAPLKNLQKLVAFNTAASGAKEPSPFVSLGHQQPRRILAVDRAARRVVLLRETSLETYELLWERPIETPDFECHLVQWLGDAPPEGEEPRGLGDGHGRVLIQVGPNQLIEVDTRTERVVRELAAEDHHGPSPATSEGTQRLSTGHTVEIAAQTDPPKEPKDGPQPAQLIERSKDGEIEWTFQDHDRFPRGFVAAQVIERTPRKKSSRPQ